MDTTAAMRDGTELERATPLLPVPDDIRYPHLHVRPAIGLTRSKGDCLPTESTLPIHDMEQRHTGLTKAIADSNNQAACVCLDRHHQAPTDFELETRGFRTTATVEWDRPDERTRRAWANETNATEAGAYACGLAAVELTRGLVAVQRAETLTGADYYVARPGDSPHDL